MEKGRILSVLRSRQRKSSRSDRGEWMDCFNSLRPFVFEEYRAGGAGEERCTKREA